MASRIVQGLSLAAGGRGGRAEEEEAVVVVVLVLVLVVLPPAAAGFRFERAVRRASMRDLPETYGLLGALYWARALVEKRAWRLPTTTMLVPDRALAMEEAAATVVRQTDWSAERSSMIAGPVYMVKKSRVSKMEDGVKYGGPKNPEGWTITHSIGHERAAPSGRKERAAAYRAVDFQNLQSTSHQTSSDGRARFGAPAPA